MDSLTFWTIFLVGAFITNTLWVVFMRKWIKETIEPWAIERKIYESEVNYPNKKKTYMQVLKEISKDVKDSCNAAAIIVGFFSYAP